MLGTSVLPNQNRGIELLEIKVEPLVLVIDRINDEPNGLRVILIESKPRCLEKDDTTSLVAEVPLHIIH